MRYIVSTDRKLRPIRDCVASYLATGYGVCRLTPGEKNPLYRRWSTASLADPGLFADTDNVGLLTGWLSEPLPGLYLVGVDLDDLVAVRLADQHLPHTEMVEGRRSKPRSHRYYLVPTDTISADHTSTAEQATDAARRAGKHPGPRKVQFRHPDGRVLVELIGTGGQLAAPPSVHPCGEFREWDTGTMGPPAVVPWPDLHAAVVRLAVACGWRPTDRKPPAVPGGGAADVPVVPDVPASERVRRAGWYMRDARGGTGIPGTREGTGARGKAFGLACRLVNGFDLDPDEALPLLAAWGRRDDQLGRDGHWYPWDEDALLGFLTDADRKGDHLGRPRGYLLGGPADLPEPDVAELRKHFFGSRVG